MTVKAAAEALAAALKTVPKLRVYSDPSATIDPPGAIVGPPRLQFEGYCLEPTAATFPIYLVGKLDGRVLERFWELVPQVAAAIDDGVPDAAVTRADPGVYNAGGNDLPSYELTTEVSL